MERYTNNLNIFHILVVAILWLLWELSKDEMSGIVRQHIPGGGPLMYVINHPSIIMPAILIVICLIIVMRNRMVTKENNRDKLDTETAVNSFDTNGVLSIEGFEFHKHRPSLNWLREKLRLTKTAWDLWVVGESVVAGNLINETNFKKILLIEPSNKNLKSIAYIMDRPYDALVKSIQCLTEKAELRYKGSVKWYTEATPSLITIGDPELDTAWAFVETFILGLEADERPSFIVYKKEHPELFNRMYNAYQNIWDKSKPPLLGGKFAIF